MTLWKKHAWQRRAGSFGDRKIPARLDITGDVAKGKELRNTALSMLNMLENSQRIQQEWMTRKLNDGSVIQIYSGPNLKQISIHVPLSESKTPLITVIKKCFCTCHLALGKIVNHTRYACYDFMDKNTTYDVEVCHRGNPYQYTLISGAKPMLLTPFENEQMVLVVFEPDTISDPFIPSDAQGCAMIKCRITDISNSELLFWRQQIYG